MKLEMKYSNQHILLPMIMLAFACLTITTGNAEPLAQIEGDKTAAIQKTSAQAEAITFTRRASRVGDEVGQDMMVALDSTVKMSQEGQEIERMKSTMKRESRRLIRVEQVTSGMATAAKIRFLKSVRNATNNDKKMPPVVDPVQGKTYFCKRDGKKLVVTDAKGNLPTMAEYEQVAESMQMLGQPNPLANFLAGKQFQIGQRVTLPREVAANALGLSGDFGEVKQFELTLTGTKNVGGVKCAVFQTKILATATDEMSIQMEISGPMLLEIATCRTISTEFSGPIRIGGSDIKSGGEVIPVSYETSGQGKLSVQIRAAYRDSKE